LCNDRYLYGLYRLEIAGEWETMAKYRMTVVFDVNEELEMKYVHRELMDLEATVAYEPMKRTEDTAVISERKPHINNLYDDVIERIETSLKHPITYDIVSFEKLNGE
jgi:hypothetical protein